MRDNLTFAMRDILLAMLKGYHKITHYLKGHYRESKSENPPVQGPKFPLIRRFHQGPVEVGATPSPWQQCPEGGVQRPSSSTDLPRSCEGGQSRIVLIVPL